VVNNRPFGAIRFSTLAPRRRHRPGGTRLLSRTVRLPKLRVHRDWHTGVDHASAQATFSLFDHRDGDPIMYYQVCDSHQALGFGGLVCVPH
jgi:hypothetical protein